jgi:hypothetical protein
VEEARSVVPSNCYGATISLQLTFDYGAGYSGGSTLLTSPPLVSMRKDLPTRWCAAEEVSLSVGTKSRGGGGVAVVVGHGPCLPSWRRAVVVWRLRESKGRSAEGMRPRGVHEGDHRINEEREGV